MEVRIKPIHIKLKALKNDVVSAETQFGKVDVPMSNFAFITQGLAYQQRPFKVTASPKLTEAFYNSLNSQVCLSHLARDISPFLSNYLTNKCSSNISTYESFFEHLKPTKRILFCGAGPSLYESWEFVEWCLKTGYATVIAGGSAIKAFELQGLIPDICLACDPHPAVLNRGCVSEEFAKSTVLLAGSGVYPEFLTAWPGPKVLTNGMSALPMGKYFEPTKEMLSEGGIGVSTFSMGLASALPDVEELFLLGVDLCPTSDKQVYPDHLGFKTEIDPSREHLWTCEANYLGLLAKKTSYRVINLSIKGRQIPGSTKVPTNRVLDWELKPINRVLPTLTGYNREEFISKCVFFSSELINLDLNDITRSPVYKAFIEIYHNVYLSRTLYTGEYSREPMLLKIECLKSFLRELLESIKR